LDLNTCGQAAALGAVAGLRALMAPALLSYIASNRKNTEFANNFLTSRKISVVLGLLAAGELVGDKLPFTPNRTDALGLVARVFSGAAVGGSICASRKKSVSAGIAIGALSSVAAAYAGQNLRQAIAEQSGISSAVLGVVEDAIAIGIGMKVLESGDQTDSKTECVNLVSNLSTNVPRF